MEAETKNLSKCEELKTEHLINTAKNLMKEIVDFNFEFTEFIEDHRKLARELWNNVTRYNILDGGPPCEYPIVPKEELLEELLVKIQDQTTRIHQSLIAIKEKYDKLPQINKVLEQQSDQTDWNPVTNFAIKGTVKHKSPSEYLEDIADILYQYDIAITCMFHYFNALSIRDNDSYQNLMNSFSISRELSDFVNEFKINVLMLIK